MKLPHMFLLAALAAAGAQTPSTSAPGEQATLNYIHAAWDHLTRSVVDCSSLSDVKVNETPVLYLPAEVAAPPDVAAPIFVDTNWGATPPGFTIDPMQAIAIAKAAPKMQAIHRAHHPLDINVYEWVHSHYEIYFFYHGKLIADQIVSAHSQLGPTYTGPLMLGYYARGGYGQIFDNPWVLAGFTAMFLLPLLLLRGRRWLDRLDIAMLLGFGVSYALFDTTHLEPGVWAFYPVLIYLMVRMLIRGFKARPYGGRLDCRLPTIVLALGLVALVVARIVITLHPAGVLDVATASVLGAYKILHGQSIYYYSLGHGDTYGPINYLAYVPFEWIWPGNWGYLPRPGRRRSRSTC